MPVHARMYQRLRCPFPPFCVDLFFFFIWLVCHHGPHHGPQIANEVHQLLEHACPGCPIEKASYDDYYIDATELCHRLVTDEAVNSPALQAQVTAAPNVHVWGGAWDALNPPLWAGTHLALDIRRSLQAALGFTVSVGVARGRVGARLAGPLHKPSCVVVVPDAAHRDFLLSRPLLDIPSLGCACTAMLFRVSCLMPFVLLHYTDNSSSHPHILITSFHHHHHLHHHSGKLGTHASAALRAPLGLTDSSPLRLSDIQHLPPSSLAAATSPPAGALLAALCSGCDDGAVLPRGPQATISCERSFAGVRTLAGINSELQPLCQDLLTRVLEVGSTCLRLARLCVWWCTNFALSLCIGKMPKSTQCIYCACPCRVACKQDNMVETRAATGC